MSSVAVDVQDAGVSQSSAHLELARQDSADGPLARAHMLPCRLVLESAVVGFTVETLLKMRPGDILETKAQHNEDLTLQVNGQLLGSVKFDVTREKLAVRVTGIA